MHCRRCYKTGNIDQGYHIKCRECFYCHQVGFKDGKPPISFNTETLEAQFYHPQCIVCAHCKTFIDRNPVYDTLDNETMLFFHPNCYQCGFIDLCLCDLCIAKNSIDLLDDYSTSFDLLFS